METVYIESTIPSYLTARHATREPMASHQQFTKDYWNHEQVHFRLYSSIFEYCSYHHLHMPVICTPELLTKPQL